MLQVKNLTKFYKTGKGVSTRALDGVSLSFGDSGLVFILGKSGCGKTTLLNLLGGLIRPTEGEVIFNSQSSKNFKEGDFDKFRNKHVGFVFQEYNLIDEYKVGANVALACELQGKKPDRQTVEDILRRLELTDADGNTFYDRRISELSGGQKQRVAIARALIKNPDIILADEPTGALDSKSGEQLYTLLKELSKERLIIVVTHDRESAQNFGDRIIELADGRVESDSNPFTEECAAVSSVPATGNTKVKTDLPFVRALSMGAAGLRKFPVRLSISIILSFLCLVVFGFTLCLSFHDILTTEIKTLYSRDYSLIAVDLYAPNEKQVNSIAAFNGLDKPALVCQSSISCYEYWEMPSPADLHNPYVNFAMFGSHCVGLDSENAEEFANLTPDGRFIDKSLCRYPEAADEIAITDVKADLFIRFGYKTEEGEIIKINTPDDLIGKKISKFTITGVYSTDMSADYFRQYDVDNYKNVDIFGNLKESPADKYFSGANNCSAISFIYTSSEFTESIFDSSSGRYLLKLSGYFDKDYSFLKSLGVYQKEPDRDWYIADMDSPCWNIIEPLTILDSINIAFYLVPAIVFGVIAALMTLNVLLTNLDSRNKEMGILRAMGAGKKSVMSICLSESLILAVSNFILSLAGLGILTAILNAAFYCKLIIMDIKVVAIMLACSVGIAAIATLFTMIKILKSKPIDIINKS